MVLDCMLKPDQPLDAATLAESVGAGLSSIHYALTRLVGEGLVLRTADCGYVVTHSTRRVPTTPSTPG